MSKGTTSYLCPLCSSKKTIFFHRENDKDYWKCQICTFIFVAPLDHLSKEEELYRYRQHENNPNDQDYRDFLSRLSNQLIPKLRTGSYGLDYGSGPGPTLSVMLEEKGFLMANYDMFFSCDETLLLRQYDFICSTETIEHFRKPGKEFQRISKMLKIGAWFAIMTEILDSEEKFPGWWYHRDPTHIGFYQNSTFAWIAEHFAWKLESPARNVILFQNEQGSIK